MTGEEGRGNTKPHFYADDGLVASTDPEWLQGMFYNLTGIFDRVGL